MPWGTDAYGTAQWAAGSDSGNRIVQLVGIPSGESFSLGTMKFNLTVTQPAGIPSAEAFSAGNLAARLAQSAGIPSAEAFGAGSITFTIRMLSGIPSAEFFGRGRVLVSYIPGWILKAYTISGQVVAEINKYSNLTFQDVLSDKGTGRVDVAFDYAKSAGLLGKELVWRVIFDGETVFSFLTEAADEALVDESQLQSVTFSGPGVAEVLEWGTTLPPGYPSYTSRSWIWESERAMAAWLDLFNAARARGAILMVMPSFSDATDSFGNSWTESLDLTSEPGGSVYSHLQSMAALADADWHMSPTFGLDVSASYGVDRSQQVRFHVAANQIAFKRGSSRRDLRNVVYAEGADASIQEAMDGGSVSTWDRREVYAQAGQAASASTLTQVATAIVELQREEQVQITCSVVADGAGHKIYHDYAVGDWVGFDIADGTQVNYRVVSITVGVDEQGTATAELGLQSLFQLHEKKLEKLIASGGGSISASGNLQTGIPPAGVIDSIIATPVPDAPTGVSVSTGANENRVYLDVTWITVPSSGPDPVVEYEIELTRDGEGVVSAVRAIEAPVRIEPVEPNVDYSVRVRAITRLGRSTAWSNPDTITAGQDDTLPDTPVGLMAGFGIRTITVTWDENTEIDVKDGRGAYDVQLDTVSSFNSVNLRTKRVTATVMSFTDIPSNPVPPTVAPTYYVRVRAVDSSGNVSPYSSHVSGQTQTAGTGDISPLAIDSTLIADAAITNAKIANLAVDSAKILELSATKISAGTITAASITLGSGGVLRAGRSSAPYHYLLLDENGIRFFINGSAPFTAGTLTVDLNVNSGNASFTGSITSGATISGAAISGGTISGTTITGGLVRTATSGRRVEMGSSFWSEVRMYSGHGSEYEPGKILADVTGGLAYTHIATPLVSGQNSGYLQIGCGSLSTQLVAPGHISMWAGGGSQRLQIAAGGSGGASWIRTEMGLKLSSHTDSGAIAYIGWYDANQIDLDAYEVRVNARFRSQGITDNGGGGLYFWNIPGGSDVDAILRLAGSSQILQYTSSIKAKQDVEPLSSLMEDNPVWKMNTVTFRWRNRPPEETARLDRLRPGGRSIGFIAEEMYVLSPACTTFNADDEPNGVNESAVLAYTVAGLQHVLSRIEAIEALPAIERALKKGI